MSNLVARRSVTETARLWEAYQQLSPSMRTIMRLKALIGSPVGKTSFLGCLTHSGTRTADDRAWSWAAANPLLETLKAKRLLDDNLGCRRELLHAIAADAADSPDGKALIAAIERGLPSPGYYYASMMQTDEGAYRRLRLALYGDELELYLKLRGLYDAGYSSARGPYFLQDMFGEAAVSVDWLARRPPAVQIDVIGARLLGFLASGRADPDLTQLVEYSRTLPESEEPTALPGMLLSVALLRGDLAGLRHYAVSPPDPYLGAVSAALVSFLEGRNGDALELFRKAHKLLRERTRKRKIFFGGIVGLLSVMAQLRAEDPLLHGEIQAAVDAGAGAGDAYEAGFQAMHALLWLVQGLDHKAAALLAALRSDMPAEPFSAACVGLAELLLDEHLARRHWRDTETRYGDTRDAFPLVARIQAEVLARVADRPERYLESLDPALVSFAGLLSVRPAWERALDSLAGLLSTGAPAAPSARPVSKRLAWFVDPATGEINALEQSIKKTGGGWSDGRAVAMKRLHEQDPRLDYLTEHDRRVLRTLQKEAGGWYGEVTYSIDPYKTLLALVGHPTVFHAQRRTEPLDLVAYPAELVVTETKRGFTVKLSHQAEVPSVVLESDSPGRYRVIDVSAKVLTLRDTLGSAGLHLPLAARERVVALARARDSALPVRAEIAALESEAEDGIATPVLQLQPVGEGLRVRLMVRPFGAAGPSYPAGQGGASLLALVDRRQQRVRRDLAAERAAAQALIAACPTLERMGGAEHDWQLADLGSCLELMLELQDVTLPVIIEWPEGKSLKVSRPVAADRVALSLSRSREWLHVEGTIKVDDALVLTMQDLLERLDGASGRFVRLDDGSFLALTQKLQGQLQRLAQLSDVEKSGRRLPVYGSDAVEDLIADAGSVKADKQWKAFTERARAAQAHAPVVPATLQAELRDYQIEGFAWMSRLARWGAGACLADDMGLGKTVQAIAVLLEQGGAGPSLVIAPTSVCHNWTIELARFAPTLTVHRLAVPVAERAALIASLGPMDVLVASYGLLHQEAENLSGVTWRVAVFDEAQAIKNADSKRAQASQRLQAEFRLALTGTPIENYLDELWSLFNVINPGLLGARERFQRRYAVPIERDRDADARQALRSLIRPFILRRTKSAVLSELPPRTEITLEIELPEAERAFYEALRLRALEAVENLDAVQPGQRRIHILAEIGRLRQACCHPGLVDPETQLPGAKLAAFLELVTDLIRNRHRALVFSQFIGQLSRIRAALDQQGICYQYLDGSTPVRDRSRAVDAFQAGEGELFLISLKAGGVGLNLTAADYVIHLDPWWNPAVEDQASDRAHRIGQLRPVTVYRLIAEGTIEEKIVQLHKNKRDLAADLLDGAEISGRLSEDALLDLLAAAPE